ncbi:hypothetical protein Vadar_013306 [Vaccinium darrowii]|uniref:Uncharacterized protein n=1 Tax=Vaccinium darrowii TaxID=229202 RepID=A0ACB7YLV5_9ERIC|nr:hypothetical protein Vadar_013306 [Vaccinium darrowii]
MEAYSFSSLRDMLERPPSHNSKFSGLLSSHSQHPISKSQVPHDNPPPNRSLQTNTIENTSDKTNFGKDKVTKHGCMYNKKSQRKNERLFPPPISCLKSAKSGEPFNYFRFDKNSSKFVPDEIRIPRQGLLRSSRGSGRLKLNFADEEPEEEEDEDEEEKNGKEASDEEWEVVDFGLCGLDE